MRKLAVAIALLTGFLAGATARAGDTETVAAINAAADALDMAFEQQDASAIDSLTTDDHIAVTPYYDRPLSVAEQIATLRDLKYEQTNLDDPEVTLLGEGVAMRTFSAELDGTFKGRRIPSPVFITSIMVQRDGKWQERFYQATRLAGTRSGRFGPCMGLAGTYLTKNSAKGGSGVLSRSLVTLRRGGQVAFTDSGEAGEPGFAPFSGGQGVWQCRSGDDTLKAKAVVFDFTFPKAGEGAGKIGRLDLDLSFDAKSKALSGSGTLRLVPLDGDPLKEDGLGEGRQFLIEGTRIELPE